jgi:hypothetical protein
MGFIRTLPVLGCRLLLNAAPNEFTRQSIAD